MSVAEMIRKLPTLSVKERARLRAKLDELDDYPEQDDDLTPEQEKMVMHRIEQMKLHPEKMIPWEKAYAELRERYGE